MKKVGHDASNDFRFREQYAYQVLQFIDSDRYHSLIKSERPDYITPDHTIGLEVVSAIPSNLQEAESLFSRISSGQSKRPNDDIERLNRTGSELICDNNEAPIAIIEPAYWVSFEPIESTVSNKLKLLNSGYTECLENELFIYTEIGPGLETSENCLLWLRELSKPFPRCFDKIILNEPYLLVVFDIARGKYRNIPFSVSDFEKCCNACRRS